MKENLKLGLTLLAITAIAGFILAFSYDITRKPIAARAAAEKAEAMKTVLEAEAFEDIDVDGTKDAITSISEAKNGSETVGYVFSVLTKGYGGEIELLVGINSNDSTISGIQVLKQNETPGLGSKAQDDPSFAEGFKGLPADKDLAVKTDITPISGATITSTGVTNGVNTCIQYYNENLKGAK